MENPSEHFIKLFPLTNSEHIKSIKRMLKGANDCAIISKGRKMVHTSRFLLSSHSALLKACLEDWPVGSGQCVITLPDASHQALKKLIEVLSVGQTNGTKQELMEVKDLARELQITTPKSSSLRWSMSQIEDDGIDSGRQAGSPAHGSAFSMISSSQSANPGAAQMQQLAPSTSSISDTLENPQNSMTSNSSIPQENQACANEPAAITRGQRYNSQAPSMTTTFDHDTLENPQTSMTSNSSIPQENQACANEPAAITRGQRYNSQAPSMTMTFDHDTLRDSQTTRASYTTIPQREVSQSRSSSSMSNTAEDPRTGMAPGCSFYDRYNKHQRSDSHPAEVTLARQHRDASSSRSNSALSIMGDLPQSDNELATSWRRREASSSRSLSSLSSRTSTSSKRRRLYSSEALERAIHMAETGTPLAKASKTCDVPLSALRKTLTRVDDAPGKHRWIRDPSFRPTPSTEQDSTMARLGSCIAPGTLVVPQVSPMMFMDHLYSMHHQQQAQMQLAQLQHQVQLQQQIQLQQRAYVPQQAHMPQQAHVAQRAAIPHRPQHAHVPQQARVPQRARVPHQAHIQQPGHQQQLRHQEHE